MTLSRDEVRLFRLNAGAAWAGTIVERTARKLVLLDYHSVRLAPEGFADIDGWTSVTVTPDMVGQRVAIWTSVEAKFGRRKATPQQQTFINVVNEAGGRAGIAYSVDDARRIITP